MNTNQQILLNIDAKVQSANAATSLRELKQLTRELQSEALKYQGVNEEAFQAAQRAAAGMADKIDDVREAISAAKGEPLEQLNSGVSLLRQSIFDLDFDKAVTGINAMSNGIKSIDITKVGEGFSKVATSLANLGKAALSNPYVLLAVALVSLIMNFEKLTNLLGPIGDIFKGINLLLKDFVRGFEDLTDQLGLTSNALDRMIEKSGIAAERIKRVQQNLAEVASTLGEEDAAKLLKLDSLIFELDYASKKVMQFVEKNGYMAENLTARNIGSMLLLFKDPKIQKEYDEVTNKVRDIQDQYNIALASTIKQHKDLLMSNFDLENQLYELSTSNSEEVERRKLNTFYLNSKNKLAEEQKNIDATREANETLFQDAIKIGLRGNGLAKATNMRLLDIIDETNLVIIEKQKELQSKKELLDKNYEKAFAALQIKHALERISRNKANSDKEQQTYLKEQQTRYEKGLMTADEYENAKLSIILDGIQKQEKYVTEEFDQRIKEAGTNVKLVEALEKEKFLVLRNLNMQYDDASKETEEKRAKRHEDGVKEWERLEKERIEFQKNALESQRNQFQEQADMDASELQRLTLGKDKFKLNTQEKLDIVNDMYVNQSAALRTSMELELNQIDVSEERKQQIREIYAEKQKLLAAQTADAKLQIEQEATQRQIANMQYLADSFNGIADFMTVMDNMRRDESGKLDEASQRRAFFRNKALQTGSAIMNTAAGITNALSTQNYPGAIAIGIAGAAQIAKILATRFEPENGGGGSGGTSTTGGGGSITPPTPASAPSAPLMGQGYLNQQFNPMTFGGAVGFRPGGEQRVIVLEQDITAMQNRVRVMTGRSTLSGTV